MITGAHLRNEAELNPSDYVPFSQGIFTGALAFAYQKPEAIVSLVTPANCVVRLRDSIYTDVVNDPTGKTKYIPSSQQYADDIYSEIVRWHPHGFKIFQVDNEPNYSWPQHNQGAGDWATFMREAITYLKQKPNLPPDILLLFTPLAVGTMLSNTDYVAWIAAAVQSGLMELFGGIAAHAYWQPSQYMDHLAFGGMWKNYTQFDKPIYITEAGCSIQETGLDMEKVHIQRASDYPLYLSMLARERLVAGVYFYILGSNGDWAGFELGDSVIAALKGWDTPVAKLPYDVGTYSPNRWTAADLAARGVVRKPAKIVIHQTWGSYPSDYDYMHNPKPPNNSPVSAHLYIRKYGPATLFVPLEDAAWGCYTDPKNKTNNPKLWAFWPEANQNWHAINIECESLDGELLTSAQFNKLAELIAYLVNRFNIPFDRYHIVGHGELSTVKHDPIKLDWDALFGAVSVLRGSRLPTEPPPPTPPPVPAPLPPGSSGTILGQADPRAYLAYSQTGHGVYGEIRVFWELGGVGIYGYPLTEEADEIQTDGSVIRVQYFENVRIEYRDAPNYPRLGAVGRQYIALKNKT